MEQLNKSRVLIFGMGGVGGYTVEALARSGIGHLTLVDSDVVDITNINRQLIATFDTVGKPKVDLFKERIHVISPDAEVITHQVFYLPKKQKHTSENKDFENKDFENQYSENRDSDNQDSVIEFNRRAGLDSINKEAPAPKSDISLLIPTDNVVTGDFFDFDNYDYVIDAIDTVSAKLDIIERCHKRGTPIISAMGCGNRLDPTKLMVTDIFKTENDPLAKVIRKGLRDRGIKKLKVVASSELPLKPIFQSSSDAPRPGKRVVPGSTSFVPSAAGLIIASEVVRDLIK